MVHTFDGLGQRYGAQQGKEISISKYKSIHKFSKLGKVNI
jgi:hypothetical protein